MKKYKAILIDDEKRSIDLLTHLLTINFSDKVEIVGCYTNPMEGIAAVGSTKPDLIFLDVILDGYQMTGIDILYLIKDHPVFPIFVSGYHEFVLEAANLSDLYYVLKPPTTETIREAIGKFERRFSSNTDQHLIKDKISTMSSNIGSEPKNQKVFLWNGRSYDAFVLKEIEYIESEGNLCKVFANGKKYYVNYLLGELIDKRLPKSLFYRIHRKHLVGKDQIIQYFPVDGYVKLTSGTQLKVAGAKRSGFRDWLEEN